MELPSHHLLRVYLGESDQVGGRPVYEVLVERARAFQLSGATVLRGPLGFGRSSRLHTARVLRLSDDLPLLVEIVDEEHRLRSFLEQCGDLLAGLLVTLEKVEVVDCTGASPAPPTAQ